MGAGSDVADVHGRDARLTFPRHRTALDFAGRLVPDAHELLAPVLVTGAGGCLGAWTLVALVQAGVKVCAFDVSPDRSRPTLLTDHPGLHGVDWITGDIAHAGDVETAFAASGARSVIHVAGLQTPACRADPMQGAAVNVLGTLHVFEAARRHRVARLAYASSLGALGAEPGSTWGVSLYNAWKYCDEQIARAYWHDHRVASIGLRLGVLYGVGRDAGQSAGGTFAMLAAAAGRDFRVPFTGPVTWLHAAEAASALVQAIASARDGAAVLPLSGDGATVESMLARLALLVPGMRVDCAGAPLPYPADLPDAPTRQHLGPFARIPLGEGLDATVAHFRRLIAARRLDPDVWLARQ
jgi:nucleoside-diphosphate-sugar epimerase